MKFDKTPDVSGKPDMQRQILDTAFALIRQCGLTHTSIEKITKSVGIGKGSFYAYFSSKEEMVYALMKHLAEESYADFLRRLAGRERMTEEEGKQYFRFIAEGQYSIYPYLTTKDMDNLARALGNERYDEISMGDQVETMRTLLSRIENVRDEVDYQLVVSLFKVTNLASRNWHDLSNLPAKDETLDIVYAHLFSLIFV